MRFFARAVTRGGVHASGIFYRLERSGPVIPDGPALIVVNHSNMLMDPLLALGATRRRVRTIVKAPHFRTPVFGSILQGVDALPVYRLRDDPKLMARNKTTLRHAADVLLAGGALLLFPEGGSHPGPRLRPLKAGAARLALTAEAESGWTLGLVVVPVGLAYENRDTFRSRALAAVGQPLPVSRWRAAYGEDRVSAIRGDGGVPSEGAMLSAAREVGVRAAMLVPGAPLAALGAIVWYVPYALAGFANRVGKPAWETVATVKVLAGLVLFPATYVGWIVVSGYVAGAIAALATAVALPPLLLFTLRWGDARGEVWGDMRVLWRAARWPRTYKRLLRHRINLVAELEPLAAEARTAEEGRHTAGRSSP